MKKTEMLKKNYEFKKVLTKGKCISGKYLIAFVQKNNCKKNIIKRLKCNPSCDIVKI